MLHEFPNNIGRVEKKPLVNQNELLANNIFTSIKNLGATDAQKREKFQEFYAWLMLRLLNENEKGDHIAVDDSFLAILTENNISVNALGDIRDANSIINNFLKKCTEKDIYSASLIDFFKKSLEQVQETLSLKKNAESILRFLTTDFRGEQKSPGQITQAAIHFWDCFIYEIEDDNDQVSNREQFASILTKIGLSIEDLKKNYAQYLDFLKHQGLIPEFDDYIKKQIDTVLKNNTPESGLDDIMKSLLEEY